MPQPKILLLEDNLKLRNNLKAGIERAFDGQVDVYPAGSVEEAEQLLSEHDSGFDLLITDVMMPDGQPGGLDIAAIVAPWMPVIVISAFKPESFKRDTASLGRTVFLQKSSDKAFRTTLIDEVGKSLETKEVRSLCLQRHRGTILAVRFHLPHVVIEDVPHVDVRDQDLLAIGFGVREWQASLEPLNGRIYSIHSQSMLSVFTDNDTPHKSDMNAIQSFLDVCSKTAGEQRAGFDRCPFSAAAVPGMLLSGVFGNHPPGLAAIIGRTGDISEQLTRLAKPREIAVVEGWLTAECRKWFRKLPGERRAERLMLVNLTSPIEVSFLRP